MDYQLKAFVCTREQEAHLSVLNTKLVHHRVLVQLHPFECRKVRSAYL